MDHCVYENKKKMCQELIRNLLDWQRRGVDDDLHNLCVNAKVLQRNIVKEYTTYRNLSLICGKILAKYCPSSTAESKCGSIQALGAARSNATGNVTLQHECLLPCFVKYSWMCGANEICISSTELHLLPSITPGGIGVNETDGWLYEELLAD